MEILHPQGDPFAEPQVLTMSHFAKSGVLKQLSERMHTLLQEYKILKAKREHGAEVDAEIEEHQSKLKLFIHRFLLLWSVICRFCPEQVHQNFPSTQLAGLVDSIVETLDSTCKDKYLQVEYVKFLRILVIGEDENTNAAFMNSRHFLNVIQSVCWKDNMISAQVNAVFNELRKLQSLKLLLLFVETHKELLEKLKEGNSFLAALLTHYMKLARRKIKNSFQMDEEKTSGFLSDRGSDKLDLHGVSSPISSISAPHGSPIALDNETNEIKNLKALLLSKKAKSSDDEDDDSHEIFSGLGHPIRNFNQSPAKPRSPEKPPSLYGSDEKKSSITIDLGISLSKKEIDDNGDDEEFYDNSGSQPTKKLNQN